MSGLRQFIRFLIWSIVIFMCGFVFLDMRKLEQQEEAQGPTSMPIESPKIYRADILKGEAAIARLGEHHRLIPLEPSWSSPFRWLAAASDYKGETIVVAGELAQLYIFRKKKGQYQLKQVLWDGKTERIPMSVAISENGRYVGVSTLAETEASKNIAKHNAGIPALNFLYGTILQVMETFWDIEKEEKIQDDISSMPILTHVLAGSRLESLLESNEFLSGTAGNTLFMTGRGMVHNADLSGKKYIFELSIIKEGDEKSRNDSQAAYSPLTRQILSLKYPPMQVAEEKPALYRVYDESREKWWKFWSDEITIGKIPDALQAYRPEGKSRRLPAMGISPDGKFFVVLRHDGELAAHSLPDGALLANIQTSDAMEITPSPKIIVDDGIVYLSQTLNHPDGEKFWSWKPGESKIDSHYLRCANYTSLLASGHIMTLGCDKERPELRLVSLSGNSGSQVFPHPLRLP
jgi:hypothetical protein